MTKIFDRETAHPSDFAPIREGPGEAIIRWGALAALVVEACLVGTGIAVSIMGL